MLFIRRKKDQSFFITSECGQLVTIRVVNIYNDCITIGIDAPDDWVIERDNMRRSNAIKGANR